MRKLMMLAGALLCTLCCTAAPSHCNLRHLREPFVEYHGILNDLSKLIPDLEYRPFNMVYVNGTMMYDMPLSLKFEEVNLVEIVNGNDRTIVYKRPIPLKSTTTVTTEIAYTNIAERIEQLKKQVWTEKAAYPVYHPSKAEVELEDLLLRQTTTPTVKNSEPRKEAPRGGTKNP